MHGDLHWANLLAPQLGIVDWELWGRGPADPAATPGSWARMARQVAATRA